jgi:hypothetical protein
LANAKSTPHESARYVKTPMLLLIRKTIIDRSEVTQPQSNFFDAQHDFDSTAHFRFPACKNLFNIE